MSKIFIRIYLFMIATIVSGILLGYVLLLPFLQTIEKKDDLRVLRGTFHLLNQRLEKISANMWEEEIRALANRHGNLISLAPLKTISTSDKELTGLPNGNLVSTYDDDIFFQRIKKSNFVIKMQPRIHGSYWFMGEDDRVTDLTVSLIFESLTMLAPQNWPEYIREVSRSFGFPVQLVPMGSAKVSEEDKNRLRQGLRVLNFEDEIVYQPIRDSPLLLTLGPLAQGKPWLLRFALYLIGALLLVVSGLGSLIWARPLWRDMDQLSSAAQSLGRGDFSSRAQLRSGSYLRNLSDVFDSMAVRLQALISGHKDLVNAVSHELRTPIMRMRFASELFDEPGKLSHEQRRLLVDFNDNMDELDNLINEILTYAKIEHVAPDFTIKAVPAKTWLNDIIAPYRLPQQSQTPHIDIHLQDGLSTILIDPEMMHRALGNLLQNAIKHAHGKVQVTLETSPHSYTVHVDDDGQGIPTPERERIFSPFIQLEKGQDKPTGYGLGLSIVQRIAQWHQGTVVADISPLGGARFTLCWPKTDV